MDYNFYNRIPKIKKLDLYWSASGGANRAGGVKYKNLILLSSIFFSLFLNKDFFKMIHLQAGGSESKRKGLRIYKSVPWSEVNEFLLRLNLFAKLVMKLEIRDIQFMETERLKLEIKCHNVLAKFFKLEGAFNILNVNELYLLLTLYDSDQTQIDRSTSRRIFRALVRGLTPKR